MPDKQYTAEYGLDDLLNELPISLAYEEGTKNAKLLSLYADGMVDTLKLIQKIDDWRNIDNAEGVALDMIGNDRGVYRNGADDAFYRFEIKTKQLQRMTDGTYDSLIKLVCDALDADYDEVNVRPMYESTGEPDAIEITNIPGHYIDDERKEQLLFDRLQESLAAGIRLANVEFVKEVTGSLYMTGFAQTSTHDVAYMNQHYDQNLSLTGSTMLNSGIVTHNQDNVTMKGGLD
ncbi:hypothetical protein GCM10022296_13260 [Secundilactobacillus similis DSM 23365 = JCM 2765]|uniref:Uncharacterized protein n=1 Tax=Secundilactobacillus similis DSM 23365 = JCM 2765 TaxID=1423804 RepID=A0A0R2EWT1_9LACO|nr:hypothetical protein [Secundilactobacillus similis]KRN20670.1 hypothetical protein FD14_GL001460 [Secundilactobacillus similis DSM 23365 = JCM 2765]